MKFGGYKVILMSVRSFVHLSVPPSQSLIRCSSKTSEQNFMKLSGIVHYIHTAPPILKFWGVPQQTRALPLRHMGGGTHL